MLQNQFWFGEMQKSWIKYTFLLVPQTKIYMSGNWICLMYSIVGATKKWSQTLPKWLNFSWDQKSKILILPAGNNSIFLDANKIKCRGLTMVILLQETALVRIFSPKTKNGTGNWIASRELFTLDLWIKAFLASVVKTLRFSCKL